MEKNNKIEIELTNLKEQIEIFLEKCDTDQGQRSKMAEQLILQAVIWSAENAYEAIEILAAAQVDYLKCSEYI